MNPSLTNRLKDNLEWLAKQMPEKFGMKQRYEDVIDFRLLHPPCLLIDFHPKNVSDKFYIYPDPFREFSNSLGRIVWEAFGERLLVYYQIPMAGAEPAWYNSSDIVLSASTELSAQIESVCIRIEQEREKQ